MSECDRVSERRNEQDSQRQGGTHLDSSLHIKVEGGCAVCGSAASQELVQLVHILQLGVAVQQQCRVVGRRLTLQHPGESDPGSGLKAAAPGIPAMTQAVSTHQWYLEAVTPAGAFPPQ